MLLARDENFAVLRIAGAVGTLLSVIPTPVGFRPFIDFHLCWSTFL
jgi:hypothetical protein